MDVGALAVRTQVAGEDDATRRKLRKLGVGEPDEDAGTLSKLKKRLFDSKGITYEELMAKKALEKQNATDE